MPCKPAQSYLSIFSQALGSACRAVILGDPTCPKKWLLPVTEEHALQFHCSEILEQPPTCPTENRTEEILCIHFCLRKYLLSIFKIQRWKIHLLWDKLPCVCLPQHAESSHLDSSITTAPGRRTSLELCLLSSALVLQPVIPSL